MLLERWSAAYLIRRSGESVLKGRLLERWSAAYLIRRSGESVLKGRLLDPGINERTAKD